MSDASEVRVAVSLLEQARRVVVLSGAGMSAESGIATFRSRDGVAGLWDQYDPMTLATAQAFSDEPELVWGWYLWRIGTMRAAAPHDGHHAIAALESRGNRDVTVVTQNVDDLHDRAGSTRVLHVHGQLNALRCFDCGATHEDAVEPPADPVRRVPPPRCRRCGGLVRPGIVWFGETLPAEVFSAGQEAVENADLVLLVGTSGVVYPAAGLPAVARAAGVPVVEINPEETPLSDMCDVLLRRPASEALRELATAVIA